MSLTERLAEYVRACFTGLWIESHEHEDALREMAQLCADQNWQLVTWNIDSGLASGGQPNDADRSASDPLAAIRTLRTATGDTATLLVLSNFHRFLNSAEIVQALAEQLVTGKQTDLRQTRWRRSGRCGLQPVTRRRCWCCRTFIAS